MIQFELSFIFQFPFVRQDLNQGGIPTETIRAVNNDASGPGAEKNLLVHIPHVVPAGVEDTLSPHQSHHVSSVTGHVF